MHHAIYILDSTFNFPCEGLHHYNHSQLPSQSSTDTHHSSRTLVGCVYRWALYVIKVLLYTSCGPLMALECSYCSVSELATSLLKRADYTFCLEPVSMGSAGAKKMPDWVILWLKGGSYWFLSSQRWLIEGKTDQWVNWDNTDTVKTSFKLQLSNYAVTGSIKFGSL